MDTEFSNVLLSQLKLGFPSGYLDMTMNVIQTSLHHGYRKAAAQATGDSERQKIIFLVSWQKSQKKSRHDFQIFTSKFLDFSKFCSKKHIGV